MLNVWRHLTAQHNPAVSPINMVWEQKNNTSATEVCDADLLYHNSVKLILLIAEKNLVR